MASSHRTILTMDQIGIMRTITPLAGLASVGWGLVVWVFGESFGGLFAPGLTWLTGAPGAGVDGAVDGADAAARFPVRLGVRFAAFDEAHGFAVNLLVVAALTVIGGAFLSGRPPLIRPALAGLTVLCLADWVLVQDLGFLGGIGTDPNSMIPFILLAAGGYLALTRGQVPLPADAAQPMLATRS